jgi:hypothetical protein
MPPRSRRLLSETSASAGCFAAAARLPPLAFALAFAGADIAALPPLGRDPVLGFAGFEMDAG